MGTRYRAGRTFRARLGGHPPPAKGNSMDKDVISGLVTDLEKAAQALQAELEKLVAQGTAEAEKIAAVVREKLAAVIAEVKALAGL
jgi:hypothetical protein